MTKYFSQYFGAHETTLICCWCGKDIPEGCEAFSLGIRVSKGIDLTPEEGKEVVLYLALFDKKVHAIVPLNDSNAKREGNDILFFLCSQECGKSLKNALQKEKELMFSLN